MMQNTAPDHQSPNTERTGVDPDERRKELKILERQVPNLFAKFFGRKLLLPKYRAADYPNLDFGNYIAFKQCLEIMLDLQGMDEVRKAAIGNTFASLHFDRPILFLDLEREPGEALLRTDLLADLSTSDIQWRWPAFKIVLARGLMLLTREDLSLAPNHQQPLEPVTESEVTSAPEGN